ncbi:hypothetical protein [Microbacterium aurantiacum]|uniref:hypothetical protein n=1 Tax=Microbacterium aurantiacum TaxID=162393 RepID=UPI0040363873
MSRTLPSAVLAVSDTEATAAVSRSWAALGIVAGFASLASVFLSMMLSPEYVAGSVMTTEVMNRHYLDRQPFMIAFHVVTVVSAFALVVFGAGLQRRLRASLQASSLLPQVAFAGVVLVAVSQIMGTALDTEFLFGTSDTAINLPGDIGLYSHWIATLPWVWAGAGLAGLALGAAGRSRAIPVWLSIVGWVLGGLTALLALSPLQYMAAGPGALWLLVTAFGFTLGDRAHRREFLRV